MSNAMSRSKSRWKGALLATVAGATLMPLAAKASMQVGLYLSPIGTSPQTLKYVDPYDPVPIYVYATVTGGSNLSASEIDGLQYLYYNVTAAITSGSTAGLGSITAATLNPNFGGSAFNNGTGGPVNGTGAQSGNISSGYTTTPIIAVGNVSNQAIMAKPRSDAPVFNSGTSSSPNVIVQGNKVSFLVETLTYTPTSAAVIANPSTPTLANVASFNISIPSLGTSYTGSNYFQDLTSTPGAGAPLGASNTSSAYSSTGTTVSLVNALPGDVNLDGVVNGTDLAIVNSGLNTSGVTGGWTAGDLTADTIINGTDLAIVNSALNTSSNQGSPTIAFLPGALIGGASVPEPTSLALLAVGGLALARRRRSKN